MLTPAQILPISQVRSQLPMLVDQVSIARTLITVKGKPAAILIDPEELSQLEETLEILSNPAARKAIEQGKRDAKNGRTVSWDELKKELGFDEVFD